MLSEFQILGSILTLLLILFAFGAPALAIGLLFYLSWAVVAQRKRRCRELLERLAPRFHGRVELPAGSFFPCLRLQIWSLPALVSFKRVGKQSYFTLLSVAWPDPHLRCEVYRQDLIADVRKFLGMEDIEIGSPSFDQAYCITGNNQAAIRALLSPAVQAQVLRFPYMQLKWSGGVLTLTRLAYLSTYEALEEFITHSAELLGLALKSSPDAIQSPSGLSEPDEAAQRCPVCGEPLAQDVVDCADCHTLHHAACWQYAGRCTTYGCGSRRCLRLASSRS